MPQDKGRDRERREHERKASSAEMSLGPSQTNISNLSRGGAFVSLLAGLHPNDSFSFELVLDGQEDNPVRGRAIVSWEDPGIGVGVRFDLSAQEESRLADYLEQLRDRGEAETQIEQETEPTD